MARATAPRARQDRGACDRSVTGPARRVGCSRLKHRWARRRCRRAAVAGAGQERPSGHAARGAGCAVVKVRLRRAVLAGPPTRPAAQRRGLLRRLLPTRPRSFRPSGASLRKQSWSGRPPPSLPAPEQSSVPDGPGEWVAGHLFRGSSRTGFGSSSGRVQMTSTSSTTSSRRTGKGKRAHLSEVQREAADAARAAKIAALHEQIGEQVEALTADPQWRAMLDAAARFHTYSLNNQLLITLQAARLGNSPTRVAGFGTWKALGRSVVKGSTGLAVLAPCTSPPRDPRVDPGTGEDPRRAAPAATTAAVHQSARRRVLRGFRLAHVFDISQTEGGP